MFVADEILTSNPFKPALPLGRTVEGLAKASAKLFLALKPPALRAELTQGRLVPRTKNTVTDPALFEQELLKIAAENLASRCRRGLRSAFAHWRRRSVEGPAKCAALFSSWCPRNVLDRAR